MYGHVGRSSFSNASRFLPTALLAQSPRLRAHRTSMHPYLIHSGHLLLPTFGVLAAVGLMAALTLSLRTASIVGLNPERLWNAGLFTLLAAFALSRLLLI